MTICPRHQRAQNVVSEHELIQNKGSDTLVNVAQAWAEDIPDHVNSEVVVAVSGGGSGTGIAAMINGTVDIANASRKMKDKEMKKPRNPGRIRLNTSWSVMMPWQSFIHEDNPANEFSFNQLGKIFGRGGDATKWSDLGIKVPGCGSDEIVVVSRQNNSGTYAYFKIVGTEEPLPRKASFPRAASARARSTCTAPRTWSTWSKKPPARLATAAWPMRPIT